MSILSRIQRGAELQPPRILIYGTEGIGKSTFVAQAPKSVIIPTEDGLGSIDCNHFPLIHTLDEVAHALADLHSEEHAFQTVVIDSLDWLERLVWDQVCAEYRVQSIDKADGGYGRGYMHALVHWRRIIAALDQLRRDRNMLTLLTAHAKIERFEDPEANAYDRFVPRLQKHAAALICEWLRCLVVRHAEDSYTHRIHGLQSPTDHRQRRGPRRRRPHSPVCGRAVLCGQKSFRDCRRAAPELGGVHGGNPTIFIGDMTW